MLFNSLEFIFLFLPITLVVFYQIGDRGYYQPALAWLVLASLFFYQVWNPDYLRLLIFSVSINYIIGSILYKSPATGRYRKLLLVLGIILNLMAIGYFKYTYFAIDNLNHILGTNFNFTHLILPLAISFFTFQQVAYLVDTYKGKARDYSFVEYIFFVTFFPQLIAGPITCHRAIIEQLGQKSIYKFSVDKVAIGLTIFLIGLFKKVLLADPISVHVSPVFDAANLGTNIRFFEAWSATLAYTFQLYFDFSGYSDMAVGCAWMFGITIPVNFNSPYKAANIIDFWRRWHITLSNFLRDYLYIPLGGNRLGELRRTSNLMVTMLLGGLWHGAGWTFIVWGGLHGLYLIINHQWHFLQKCFGWNLKDIPILSYIFGCIITFLAVVISWVFFRAIDLQSAIAIVKSMMGVNGVSFASAYVSSSKILLLHLIVLGLWVWLLPNPQEWMGKYHPLADADSIQTDNNWIDRFNPKWKWQPNPALGIILGTLVFLVVKIFFQAPKSDFLYFNF
ncbi:MAG: MBOAT family protein [Geitlerinemataceae cyanobacterium]